MTVRALVTNDDGISSEGLRRLAGAAAEVGLDVVVAAPLDDSSGSSAAVTAVESDGHIVVEERHPEGLSGIPAYGVAAVPGFIALIAARGAFGPPPDLVLSGINIGVNTGHAILHSGTVGAALTGASHGCQAIAVSLETGDELQWDTAADVARQVIPWAIDADEPLVLNVNVPDVAPDDLRGLRRADLASFGAVQTNIAEVGHGYVRVSLSDIEAELEPGTDAALLADGYATVTALNPICAAPEIALPIPAGHAHAVEDVDDEERATG